MEILSAFSAGTQSIFFVEQIALSEAKPSGCARDINLTRERERQVFDESSEWKMLQKVTACDIRTHKGLPHVSLE
jgi:hypothetical protein